MDDMTAAMVWHRDEADRLRAENERLRAALIQAKHGAEYPDELGDIIDAALGVNEQTTREETVSEHIARDIREGRFPNKSKAQQVARINKYEPDGC